MTGLAMEIGGVQKLDTKYRYQSIYRHLQFSDGEIKVLSSSTREKVE